MNTTRKTIKELSCDKYHYNKYEVEQLKQVYSKGSAIPCPFVNSKNEVVAFYSSFFALQELNVPDTGVVCLD
ncbi:hypothetical protein COV18_04340 [Candidatus Woesearchaeota archaeon CG10_big_fil_rev_8_21_14_0_10_37_12]|nr:MAG: hypothetical protein COV18_04340 [Candidatus Woesearchaeota archaeon CG10_big_fil_rev_8_21_14_0_10_37_12]